MGVGGSVSHLHMTREIWGLGSHQGACYLKVEGRCDRKQRLLKSHGKVAKSLERMTG